MAWALAATGQYAEAEKALLTGLQWVGLLDGESPSAHELAVLAHTFLAQLYQTWGQGATSSSQDEDLGRRSARQIAVVRAALESGSDRLPPVVTYRAYRTLAEYAFVQNSNGAIALYVQARDALNTYGGEAGVTLEMTLTSGFAALQEQQLDDAERLFREAETEALPHSAQLAWSYYGLAATAARYGDRHQASALLRKSKLILSLMDAEQHLHRLVEQLEASLGRSHAAETPVSFVIAGALLADIHRNREMAFNKTHAQERDNL